MGVFIISFMQIIMGEYKTWTVLTL